MKKFAVLGLAATITVGSLVGGAMLRDQVVHADDVKRSVSQQGAATISLNEAIRIAEQSVGGYVESAELETKRGKASHYEVEMQVSDGEYELDIDAWTGEILRKKFDDDDDDDDRRSRKGQSASQTNANLKVDLITEAQAKQIALDRVGGRVVEVKLDRDDGQLIYEIELRLSDGREADVDVNARTGKIIEIDIDDDDDDDDDD